MSIDHEPCTGALYHAPLPLWTERHHVIPKYLCALLNKPVIHMLAPLCSNCHVRVHHALTHLINTGENPHRLSPREMTLVVIAWMWWVGSLLEPGQ